MLTPTGCSFCMHYFDILNAPFHQTTQRAHPSVCPRVPEQGYKYCTDMSTKICSVKGEHELGALRAN